MKKQTRKIASIAAAALIALSVSVLPAANENAALPSAAITVSAASSAPKAPSKDYTGFSKEGSDTYFFENGKLKKDGLFTYEGKKYYANKDGTLLKNDWKTMKGGKYFYANNKCVVSIYEFKTGVTKEAMNDGYYYSSSNTYLFIDGKPAKASDFPEFLKKDDYYINFFRLGNDYYYLHMNYSPDDEIIPQNSVHTSTYFTEKAFSSDSISPKVQIYEVYDIGSRKKIFGKLYYQGGAYDYKTQKVTKLSAFEKDKNRIVKINVNGNSTKTTVSKNKANIVIIGSLYGSNSYGRVSCGLKWVNKTGKKIKYITFNVQCLNRVDDVVGDMISGKKTFSLQSVGPYDVDLTGSGEWEDFMKNTTVSSVIITSIDVEFMDGTSKTYTGSDFIVL